VRIITEKSLENTIINTIRTLSMDAVQKASSGHPGTPMALAPVAFTIYDRFMRFNPADPEWPNRDRFVLSAGHASMLLYSILHIMGYDLSLEDLKQFRQLHSRTAGHPEFGLTPGVEMTTGPLGQGASTSVGMAISEKWLKSHFNRPGLDIVDYNVFALASDGDMMEGISHEAASLAGHLGLGNLVWLYDNNSITIEGSTSLAFSEDVATRFRGYDWYVQIVDDANDLNSLQEALKSAVDEKEKPSLIMIKSHIAYGAPNKQDTAEAHGAPLGEEEVVAAKKFYGWPADKKFYVPEEIPAYTSKIKERGAKLQSEWDRKFADYEKAFPDLAVEFRQIQSRELPDAWQKSLPQFSPDQALATRQSNGKILDALAEKIPWLLGGSGDLMPSTKTKIADSGDFEKSDYGARNLHFGIREHAMGAIVNGMSLSKLRPFGATFLVFSDYMRPAIRLAALMGTPSIFIFTHDSIGLGEDGPTHQPVEHLAALRAIPNLDLIRPADANELSVLWKHILNSKDRPTALALTRQNVPTIDRNKFASAEGALKGAYVLADSDSQPGAILMATGSEVHLCLEVHERLKDKGIAARVVSMPCWSLFERQPDEYRRSILPDSVTARVAVEAGVTLGWERYTGDKGIILGLNRFGMSAPYEQIYSELGLTVEGVVAAAMKAMGA
jgi:transketolase